MSTRAQQYAAQVLRREQLSTHLVRLTLGGAGLAGFASTGIPDEWVGLVVPGQFQSRYYTVRSWDGGELVLDVVVHEVGLVTEWAARDCVGDTVTITEPKGSFAMPDGRRVAAAGRRPDRDAGDGPDRRDRHRRPDPDLGRGARRPARLPPGRRRRDLARAARRRARARWRRSSRAIDWPAGRRLLLDGGGVRADAGDPQAPDARAPAAGDGVRRDGLLARRHPGASRGRSTRVRSGGRARPRGSPTSRSGRSTTRRGSHEQHGDARNYRSGFASFVGRPNAGKSTLTNALVGAKVVITSSKPQTTRTVVRGIVHRPDAQLILVDTPGLHRPRTLLGERLNDLVKTTLAEVDVVAVCFPANEKIGPGDRFIVNEMAKVKRTIKVAIATKTDLATSEQIGKHLLDIQALGVETGTDWAEIVPVSAKSGDQVKLLEDLLVGLLPDGPQLYPDGDLSDAPEEAIVAELIREAALEGVRDELPHSIAVVVEEMGLREGRPDDKPLLDVHANLYVERDSQKGIVIGHKGVPPARGRHRRPQADRGDARHARLPRPARQDRQGLAARPPPAPQARLLARRWFRAGASAPLLNHRPGAPRWLRKVAQRPVSKPPDATSQAPSRGRRSGRRPTASRSATRSPTGS